MSAVGARCGNWAKRTPAGNVAIGDVVLESSRDCYVRSDGMLTAVVGLKDAVVVVTGDVAAGNAPRPRAGREDGGGTAEGAPAGMRRWRTTEPTARGDSTRA